MNSSTGISLKFRSHFTEVLDAFFDMYGIHQWMDSVQCHFEQLLHFLQVNHIMCESS